MADTGDRSRAAEFIDSEYKQWYHDLCREHLRQEKRELAFYKSRLQSHDLNRQMGEDRYVARIASIEAKEQRAAITMHKRHTSMKGRLAALAPGGKERQAQEREALQERGYQLKQQATRTFNALQERQAQAKQQDRLFVAHHLKIFRADNHEHRQAMAKAHYQTRDIKVEVRAQKMRDMAEEKLRVQLRELKQQQAKEHEQGRAHAR